MNSSNQFNISKLPTVASNPIVPEQKIPEANQLNISGVTPAVSVSFTNIIPAISHIVDTAASPLENKTNFVNNIRIPIIVDEYRLGRGILDDFREKSFTQILRDDYNPINEGRQNIVPNRIKDFL